MSLATLFSPWASFYRPPLFALLPVDAPGLGELYHHLPYHLQPVDLLASARTILIYFLPFPPEVIAANRQQPDTAPLWAEYYVRTNQVIGQFNQAIAHWLEQAGYHAAWKPATHNFDEKTLTAPWSHKSLAVAAGLAVFGRHQQAITAAGCAGRFGSLVTDAPPDWLSTQLPPAPPPEPCLDCGYCWRVCPVGALTATGLDKQKCYSRLLEVAARFTHLGLCDVCGKCSVGPCAAWEKE
ncbi:MAG: 4Fe-4S binding protein [Bacillota bacterium]